MSLKVMGETERTAVVVADAALAEDLNGWGEVITVDSYLHALGEMSRRTIHAVVGRLGPMSGSLESTVAALRQLAPAGRLILVVDPDEEPVAMRAVRLGIDDYLIRPVSRKQMIAAMAAADLPPAGPTVRVEAPVADSPVDQICVSVDDSQDIEPVSAETDLLGDTDLIEQLLADPSELRQLALRLIRQRAGGATVNWSAEEPEGNAAAVVFRNRTLGYLTGSNVDSASLQAYADWLGPWLGLEQRYSELRRQALRDDLTGVWNRRYFNRFLARVLRKAQNERFRVTVMVYDIDDFKAYNDQFGHDAGDEILCETARLMRSVVRQQDVVARIGGDEFAVIFWDAEAPRREQSEHPHSVRNAAARFQRAVCDHRFPKLAEQAPATLTISGGLASYPWDGQQADDLLKIADEALLESKRLGKNCITFGPGAMKVCGLNGPRDARI